jgi:hypothetical protein
MFISGFSKNSVKATNVNWNGVGVILTIAFAIANPVLTVNTSEKQMTQENLNISDSINLGIQNKSFKVSKQAVTTSKSTKRITVIFSQEQKKQKLGVPKRRVPGGTR